MCTVDLLVAIGAAQDEYVQEACCQKAQHSLRSFRLYVIAALITLILLLAGCAVWFYRMEHMILVDHTAEMVSAASESKRESEKTDETGPYVAQHVLSIQGYEGSPAYNALQEWLSYETDYIIQHPECRFESDFRRPDAYEIYPCYTQEMVDKVDEICKKYGLHLMGKSSFLNDADKMNEYGLNRILSSDAKTRCFYGYLYDNGSFTAEGELVLPGDNEKIIQFQMHSIRKDAFFPVTAGVNGLSSYTQWNYRTKEGFHALMALNNTSGFIITENDERFITVIIEEVPDENMVWHGLPNDKAFLQMICDSFIFSESE